MLSLGVGKGMYERVGRAPSPVNMLRAFAGFFDDADVATSYEDVATSYEDVATSSPSNSKTQ